MTACLKEHFYMLHFGEDNFASD